MDATTGQRDFIGKDGRKLQAVIIVSKYASRASDNNDMAESK